MSLHCLASRYNCDVREASFDSLWQKCYKESKQSKEALLSHLIVAPTSAVYCCRPDCLELAARLAISVIRRLAKTLLGDY